MIPGFVVLAARRSITRKERVRNLRHRGRQAVAVCVSIAMFSISSLVAFGSPSSIAKETTGLITINGTVAINGTRAESGQTLFSGSTIRTDTESESRSEEHTSELQSQSNLVCRLLLEKKKQKTKLAYHAPNS